MGLARTVARPVSLQENVSLGFGRTRRPAFWRRIIARDCLPDYSQIQISEYNLCNLLSHGPDEESSIRVESAPVYWPPISRRRFIAVTKIVGGQRDGPPPHRKPLILLSSER
jgi:hypothetical protein